ncbi:MAG: hypothetical protein ACE1Z9_07990 [Acidimicrobiia bacterium]
MQIYAIALSPRLESDWSRGASQEDLQSPSGAIVAEMRPFTAFVVIGLVVLIVVAFAVKLATTGLAP